MHSSPTTPGRRGSAFGRTASASRAAFDAGVPVRPLALEQLAPGAAAPRAVERGWASAGSSDVSVTLADQAMRSDCPGAGLQRWNSRKWQAGRHAVYRTLLDMTVFPALGREGVPLPNALYHSAVEHGLIDAATGQPTERLLRLNPGLRRPGVPP